MKETPNIPQRETVTQQAAQLQLHIAEYQALTNRCNYWMSIQVALVPLFFLVAGVCAKMWGFLPGGLVIWGSLLVSQVIAIIWLHTTQEVYTAVTYIECQLKPRIQTVLGSTAFWSYESFLDKKRGLMKLLGDCGMGMFILSALGVVIALSLHLSLSIGWNWLEIAMNVLCLGFICAQTLGLVRTRREFSRCALKSKGV